MTTPVTGAPVTGAPLQPVITALPPNPFEPCDRCGAQSLFEIVLPDGKGTLTMCNHDAKNHFRNLPETWLDKESRQQGSAS